MMKLSAPLRVGWDWNWPSAVQPGSRAVRRDRSEVERVAAELGRAGVLMLEIGYPAAEDLRGGLVAWALERAGGIGSVVVTGDVIAAVGEDELRRALAPHEIWADVTPGGEVEGGGVPPGGRQGCAWPSLRVYLTAENLGAAARLLASALEGGAERLSLPIPPLFGSFLASAGKRVPPWRDLVEFANRLDPVLKGRPGLDLRVHQQSLWTILRERGHAVEAEEAPGHGGCQAASALAYIDPGGVLYPCASLPLPIGRVAEGVIAGIWNSDELRRLRGAVAGVPAVCGGCPGWESCRGGCRGWAHFLTGSWTEPGPDCGREILERGPSQ